MRKRPGVRHRVDRFAVSLLIVKQKQAWGLGFRLRRRRKFIQPEEFDKMVDALAASAKYTYKQAVLR